MNCRPTLTTSSTNMSTSELDVELVISELGELREEQLEEVLDHLQISIKPEGKKEKYKTIVKYLLSDTLEDMEDQGIPMLGEVFDKIASLKEKSTPYRRPPTKRDRLSGFQFPTKRVSDFQEPAELSEDERMKHFLMKEFKITGKIDGSDSKDSLSYSSLCYQIQNGLKRGYQEIHIVNAVIRAFTPTHPLRQYLEGRETVTFPEMSRILRYYFREKDAASLFTTLVNARQGGSETVSDFILRLMNLRHKILFVAKGEEDDKGFSAAFVQKNFLHSALTGIREDHIRAQLRPILKCPDISDEEIMAGLMEILSEETAHDDKVKGVEKRKRALGVGATAVNEIGVPQQQHKIEKRNPLKDELEDMKGKISELTDLFHASCLAVESSKRKIVGEFRQCQKCEKSKEDIKCTHCYICGSDEHYWAGCKSKNE